MNRVRFNIGTIVCFLVLSTSFVAAQTDEPASLAKEISHLSSSFIGLLDYSEAFTLKAQAPIEDLKKLAAGSSRVAQRQVELEAARADTRASRANRLPHLETSLSAAWIANPTDPMGIKAGELGIIPALEPIILPPNDVQFYEGSGNSHYEAKVSLSQPLFSWSKIQKGIEASDAALGFASIRLSGEEQGLLLNMAANTEALAILKRMDEVLAFQAAAGQRLLYISQEYRRNGLITDSELLDARLKLKETDLARAELAQKRGQILQQLRYFSGSPQLREEDLGAALPKAGKAPYDTEEIIKRALSGNWELLTLAQLEAVKAAQEKIAKGSQTLHPDLGLKADFSWSGALENLDAAAWNDKGTWQLSIGVGLSGKLYDGGKSAAAYARSVEEKASIRLQSADAKGRIIAAIETSFIRLSLLRTQLEHSELSLALREREEADARAALSFGSAGESAVLRTLMDRSAALAEGYGRLLEYRGELWKLAGLLGSNAE